MKDGRQYRQLLCFVQKFPYFCSFVVSIPLYVGERVSFYAKISKILLVEP
nr:MAG TPA: hypothetical protein [Bacteriophage sp.]